VTGPARRRLLASLLAASLAGALLACASDAERRDRHLREAEAYLAAGKAEEALLELRSALRLEPTSAEINFRIAELLRASQRVAEALFFYGETRRLDPQHVPAALAEAELLMFDRPDQARELIDGVIGREPENAAAFVTRSKLLAVEEDLGGALQAAQRAIELAPEDPAVYQQLGKVHQAEIRQAQLLGQAPDDAQFEAALAAFARSEELLPETGRWLLHSERASLLAARPGHTDEAERTFREAIELARASRLEIAVPSVLSAAAGFARAVGRRDFLRWCLELLLERSPENLATWEILAQLEEESGGSPDAVFQRMLEARSDVPEAHLLYARYLVAHERIPEARAHLEAQADAGVDPPILLSGLANMLHTESRHDESASVVERLEREYPDHVRTVIARAQRDTYQGRHAEAAEALRAVVGRVEDPAALHLLAVAEYRLGNRSAAIAAVDRALEASANAFPVNVVRLKLQFQVELGDCTGALRTISSMIRAEQRLTTLEQVWQATCLYETNRIAVARKVLDLLLKRKPLPAPVALEFERREGERDPKRAREILERGLRDHPNHPGLTVRVAQLDAAAGKPAAALERLNRAIGARIVTPEVVLERARVLASMGQLEAAQRDALQAFQLAPGLEGASVLLTQIYRAQGREAEAIRSFEEALAAGALRPPARFLLAELHLSQGNEERARELLDTIVKERSDLPQAKNDLAYVLAKRGEDLDRALVLAEEAVRGLAGVPEATDTLGFVYLKRGLHEPALAKFREALELAEERGRSHSIYHYHAGLALQALGREEEAAAAFERALALDAGFEDARRALDGLRAGTGEPSPSTS
jgi:tetratricopeptide (TPR) repeat protein